MAGDKTGKLLKTPAHPTKGVFSERLPRIPKLLELQTIHQR
jgi:hypothetical protein